MGFWEHRAAKIIEEFDDARVESWKNQTSTAQIFFNISKKVDNRQRKWPIKRKSGVTEHLRGLHPCMDIKYPQALYISKFLQ